MGYQTLEALKERKLNNWLKKGVITKQQYKDIVYHCCQYGFWEALGYATYLKYKNNPALQKRYEYKWILIPKKDCLLRSCITSGKRFSNKKRYRIWRNIFFTTTGESRLELIKKQYPDWEVFFVKQNNYRIGLRREISNRLLTQET